MSFGSTNQFNFINYDPASTQAMQDEINLLKEENDSMQSKLVQCESGNQGAIIIKNELDSCRGDLTDEQNSKQQIYQDLLSAKQNVKSLEDENNKLNKSLQSANRNIETLKDEKKVLQTQLISEKTESDRLTDSLRNRILQLENEKGRIQSEFVYELSKEIQIELKGRKYTGIPIWTYIENYERVSSNLQGTHGT